MNRTLKTAIEYWDYLFTIPITERAHFIRYENYIVFLKQTLQLWMFIPCDKEGKPLEKPKETDYMFDVGNKPRKLIIDEAFEKDIKEYQQAQDRVIFEGFEYSKGVTYIIKNGNVVMIFSLNTGHSLFSEYQTIEDLSGKVDLVEKVAKQFKY